MKKVFALTAALLAMIALLCSCNTVPANTVFEIDDMKGKKIGVQLGTTGDIYASDYETKEEYKDAEGNLATIERYKKGADAVLALKQGKLDCVVIDNEPAKAFVANNPDLKILEEPFADEDYAIAIKKGRTDLLEKVNGALAVLKTNGTLDNIVNYYINDGDKPYKTPEGTTYPNGTIKMGTEAGFPPYEFMEGGKVVGIDIDMAQAVADYLGMELVVEVMDFDAVLASVETGKIDLGIAGMTVTDERKQKMDFSDTYAKAKQVIIVRAK